MIPKPLNSDPTFQTHWDALVDQLQRALELSGLHHLPVTEMPEALSIAAYHLKAIQDITTAWIFTQNAAQQEGDTTHAEP